MEVIMFAISCCMFFVSLCFYIRLYNRMRDLKEDIKYYRWFLHALTLLVQKRDLSGPQRSVVEKETEIAKRIVGE